MPQQVFSNSSFSSGLITHDISVQTILDVFVIQGLISAQDAESLKNRYRNNRELENIIVKNRIASRETINKAYSIILKIPYVSLANTKIDAEVIQIIPKEIAKRFGVLAFGLKSNVLQLAVSRPLELNTAFRSGMEQLMAKKPYKIEIYITGHNDFNEAIKQYDSRVSRDKINAFAYPVVFLRNQNIPQYLIKKLPLNFIEKHRAVIFDQRDEKTFLMAAERPDDSEVRRAIEYIQKQNGVEILLMATSHEDVDFVVSHYADSETAKLEITGENQVTDIQSEESEDEKNEINGDISSQNGTPSSGDEEKITLSGLFSNFKSKNRQEPVLVIDNNDVIKQEQSDENKAESDQAENQSVVEDAEKAENNTEDEDAISVQKYISEEKIEDNDPVTILEEKKNDPGEKPAKNVTPFQEDTEIGSLLEKDITNESEFEKILSERYIPKVVAAIINFALCLRSSDIHIEASSKHLRVRYRVDGILRDIAKLPLDMHPPIISRVKILAKMKIDETRVPQDGRFDVSFKHKQVDVRVSALPTVHGEKIVLRVLDKNQGVLSLEDLGMLGRAFELTVENISKPYGIILSTGPTGSGKSTTLYAILNRISTPSVNIVTLEDPVEYEIPGVNQCQIKPAIGFTFAEGLRSVLRQDPNVVMVGEVRDGETAAMATHAALTGHLVLSTLHTNDAAGALPRLTNMGVEPFLITSSINEIIAQRLVRRICPKCKEEMKLPQSLIDSIKRELEKIPQNNKRDLARIKSDFKFFHGVGCSECTNGYRGRVGIFEVLRMTEKIESLAIDKRSANDISLAMLEDGAITIRQDGLLKCLEGITTIDEVYRATSA